MQDHLVPALLAFGVVVVVPLARGLEPGPTDRGVLLRDHLGAGLLAAVSLALPRGAMAGVLCVPWLGLAIYGVVRGIPDALTWAVAPIGRLVASGYLAVGATWLVLSRYGARPLGLPDEIVELSAVHFHYAGYVAPLVALELLAWLEHSRSGKRSVLLALGAVVVGMPVTALAFTVSPTFGTVGAVFLTFGLLVVAIVTLAKVVPGAPRPGSIALTISSGSVAAAMGLALVYSLGQWSGVVAPSIEAMVWTHGLLNAVGFSFFGVVGWHLLEARDKRTPQLR